MECIGKPEQVGQLIIAGFINQYPDDVPQTGVAYMRDLSSFRYGFDY